MTKRKQTFDLCLVYPDAVRKFRFLQARLQKCFVEIDSGGCRAGNTTGRNFEARWRRGAGNGLDSLATMLCEAWQWKQPNDVLSDMVCRGVLLMLDRAGQIELPPVKFVPHNPLARRVRPTPVILDTAPIEGGLETDPALGVCASAA